VSTPAPHRVHLSRGARRRIALVRAAHPGIQTNQAAFAWVAAFAAPHRVVPVLKITERPAFSVVFARNDPGFADISAVLANFPGVSAGACARGLFEEGWRAGAEDAAAAAIETRREAALCVVARRRTTH